MLPIINLDDEKFIELFEASRKMIAGVFPEWTDYNEHDPGITFLELFAWLKEMQQFHMNQIGDNNLLMYLRLLGMSQKRRQSAKALITLSHPINDFTLPKGSKFFAGDICFESVATERIENMLLKGCVVTTKNHFESIDESLLNSGSHIKIPIFGDKPFKDDSFTIKVNEPFEMDRIHSFYFKIEDDYPVRRNPVSEDHFVPLATIKWEYLSESRWKAATILKDETHQMIQSGKCYFQITETMDCYQECYWIRLRVEEAHYHVPPVLKQLNTNVVKVEQKDTKVSWEEVEILETTSVRLGKSKEGHFKVASYLAINGNTLVFVKEHKGYRKVLDYQIEKEHDGLSCFLPSKHIGKKARVVNFAQDHSHNIFYEMDGFPNQIIQLMDLDIIYDSMEVMIEDENDGTYYLPWEKVTSFTSSKPEDRHYLFDEELGILTFGNCEKGRAPEGKMVIIGYSTTLGMGGNVKSKQINKMDYAGEYVSVINDDNAYDGWNKEAIDACFNRYIRKTKQVNRGITNEDFETLVKETPGLMIQNVKVIPIELMKQKDGALDENCVTIVVQPYATGEKATLNKAYLQNIYRYLDKKRLLGTTINILSPEYIGISLFGEISVKPHYIRANYLIKKAVDDYFMEASNHFGKGIMVSEIYGIIDSLDCVKRVESISINAQGRGVTRTMNGDVLLPVNGLVYLKESQYYVTSAE